ncbi:MAG TPA: hypothetical protein VHX38_34295 [Pseudonocardiaceae bacterium]|jgi:hypothetical protein|nr:hypothetical protein [Pseudonocardiaceae bacterium]
MSATLTLKRAGLFVELRRGQFDAEVDGNPVGSLDRQETIEVPIDPGHHTIRMRAGRYSSRPHAFDAADGETVTFQLHGANLWPIYVASLVKPDLAISLKRVDSPR